MATRRLPTEQRQRQIADAALRILAESGPKALTLNAVGAALGIRDASVLRHFKNKRAIVLAAIARFGQLLDDDLGPASAQPLERLGEFVVRRLNTAQARPELIALAYNTRLEDAAGDRAVVDSHIQRSAQFIRACIEEGQSAGTIRADVPAQMWVWIVAGVVRGAARTGPLGIVVDAQAAPSPEDTWSQLAALLVGGADP